MIRVGGATEIEVKEKKDRVEDALNATRALRSKPASCPAAAWLCSAPRRPLAASPTRTRRLQAGINIVRKALEAPIRQIAENAGVEGSIVVGKILENKSETFGSTPRPRPMSTSVEGHHRSGQGRSRGPAGRAASVAGPAGDHRGHVAELPKDSASGDAAEVGMGGMA